MKEETILCVRDSDLRALLKRKFHSSGETASFFHVGVLELLQLDGWFGPRPVLEEDPTFRQLIPYTILTYQDEVLIYQRKPKNRDQEERLASKWSIGIGGHVNLGDAATQPINGKLDMFTTLRRAQFREIVEELEFTDEMRGEDVLGFIVDDSDPVGRVHVGVVNRVQLGSRDVKPRKSIGETRWILPAEIKTFDCEGWTRIAAAAIFKQG